MPRKKYRPEEIIAKLREAEVLLGHGKTVPETIRVLGISEVTYYRWRKQYGGMNVSQAKRLKELEAENTRLRRAVSDLTLDKMILKEAARDRRAKRICSTSEQTGIVSEPRSTRM
jgi:putative transposase